MSNHRNFCECIYCLGSSYNPAALPGYIRDAQWALSDKDFARLWAESQPGRASGGLILEEQDALAGTLGETAPGIEGWRARADAGMLNANAPPVEPAPKTEPAPPLHAGEYREHAIVTGIDWNHNVVTLQLRLPIALDELPSVDDEVEVSWPGKVGE